MRVFVFIAALTALLLSACAPPPVVTETPHATFAATAPTPTPTSGPDNHMNVAITSTGVGVYQLITVPVAVVTNQSNQHSALGVVVHFSPLRNGRPLPGVASERFALPPGATVAAAADCTDACTGANGTQASVSVTSWGDAAAAPLILVSGPAYHPGSDPHIGDVTATMDAVTVPAGAEVEAFAVCTLRGVVIGGGAATISWQAAGSPMSADVPIIVSATPDACQLYAAAVA